MKIRSLIIEDRKELLEEFEIEIRLNILKEEKPIKLSGYSQKSLEERGIDIATNYQDVKKLVQKKLYDLIFLDHNMPRNKTSEPEDMGYSLIPIIKEKNPKTYIVGTSSNSNLPTQYIVNESINKSDPNFGKNLKRIYQKVRRLKWTKNLILEY